MLPNMRETPSLSQLNDCLSLLGESRLLGQLPASTSKVEDNYPLCALVITSCQLVADGLFPVFHGQSGPLHPPFPLPPPLWQTELRLLNAVIFSIIPFSGKEFLKCRFFYLVLVFALHNQTTWHRVCSCPNIQLLHKRWRKSSYLKKKLSPWDTSFLSYTQEMVL